MTFVPFTDVIHCEVREVESVDTTEQIIECIYSQLEQNISSYLIQCNFPLDKIYVYFCRLFDLLLRKKKRSIFGFSTHNMDDM